MRYFQTASEFRNVSESVGAGFSAQLARRTRVFVNGTAAYSPSYLYGLFPTINEQEPGQSIPDAPDYAVNSQESYSYSAMASLTHGLNARSDVSLSTDVSYTDFVRETAAIRDFDNYGVNAAYARRLSRHNTLSLSYRYRRGRFGSLAAGETVENGLSVGVQFARPLSASRKVTFAFNVGAATTDLPEGAAVQGISGRFYRATGDANLAYDFGRSWQVRGGYRRGLEYVAVLRDPVFTNGAVASMDGLLSRRVLLTVDAGYSSGASVVNLNSSGAFTTYTGSVRLSRGLTRTLALYAQYLYYYYDFRGSLQLQPGFPRTLDRNAARVGLTWWVPLIGR
jgi:hypothetical protein